MFNLVKRWMLKNFLGIFCLSLFLAGPSHAAVLTYNETVDGDIVTGDILAPLDAGINTVAGTVCGEIACPGYDFDLFYTSLPSAMELVSIEVSILNAAGGNGDLAESLTLKLDGVSDNKFFPGFGHHIYPIGFTGTEIFIGINGIGGAMINDYVITFNVSVVPLPSALPLYGIGLLVFGLLGWRQNTKKHRL